jgi:hypothetical protein
VRLVHGIWKNGCVVLDEKADWPEGTRVTIAPVDRNSVVAGLDEILQNIAKVGMEPVDRNSALAGLNEDDAPPDHAEIAARLALMDRIEPLEMSTEEEEEFAAWQRQVKDYTVAGETKRIDGLFP